jgi:hypothetical protein
VSGGVGTPAGQWAAAGAKLGSAGDDDLGLELNGPVGRCKCGL